jgi:4-amino-4-deoxy-L-arabinose transferase-like glycosyltransferase
MAGWERLHLFFIWLFMGVLPLFLRPLWEPDEARYAEIPREMLASGDWLTPRLNQVLYFEKPPLQYWLSAVSMKLFGLNAAAARLPLALATLILLWSAWRLSKRLGALEPVWAAFMAATTLLAYICHQILTLDALFSALLVLSLVAAIEAVVARYHERRREAMGWTLVMFGANALALLTKGLAGPVLLGGILLWSLPWAWKVPKLRNAILRLLSDPLGWLLFATISVPWFVLVEKANPGHAQFFFVHEHFMQDSPATSTPGRGPTIRSSTSSISSAFSWQVCCLGSWSRSQESGVPSRFSAARVAPSWNSVPCIVGPLLLSCWLSWCHSCSSASLGPSYRPTFCR